MSEADRVFPRRDEPGASTASAEQRLIRSAARRSGPGGAGTSRVVDVVHVQRGSPAPKADRPRPSPRGVRAETWLEGFRAKPPPPLPPPDLAPAAPDAARPVVHVRAMWEPSPPQQPQPDEAPAAPPAGPSAATGHREPRGPAPRAPKADRRRFADPFAAGDTGANCLRCGYRVERAREKRRLMTCARCG